MKDDVKIHVASSQLPSMASDDVTLVTLGISVVMVAEVSQVTILYITNIIISILHTLL